MDATMNQANGIMSFNEDWNARAMASNQNATTNYNNAVKNANFDYEAKKVKDHISEGFAGTMGGVNVLKMGANAHNFDSEIAGFGTGKGFKGYFHPYTQGQMIKGRANYAGARIRQAIGSDEKLPETAKELGMSQKTLRGNISGPEPLAKPKFGKASLGNDNISNDLGRTQEEMSGNTKNLVQTSEGVYKSPEVAAKDTVETAGANVKADSAMATAGGGMYLKGTGEAARLGGKAGLMETALKYGTDIAPKQIGAMADVAGKGMGVFGAGEAIYDRFNGDYKKDTQLQKAGNTGDMIAGGLDALSLAIPVLAPVAAVASIASAGLDLIGAGQAKTQAISTAKTKELGAYQSSKRTPGEASEGKIASAQVSNT